MRNKTIVSFVGTFLLLSFVLLTYALYHATSVLGQTKTELKDVKSRLASAETNLESANSALVQTKNELTKKDAELAGKVAQFDSERKGLIQQIKTAEDRMFLFYYDRPPQPQYDTRYLESVLRGLNWLQSYSVNSFDSTEMSACLERELENKGFHARIIVGTTPFKPGTKHAWLLVEVENAKYVPVEATAMSIVSSQSPYYNNYFKYEHDFENIQHAIQYSPTDFDWWAS